MSRSWERQVRRNSKQVNAARRKQGQSSIGGKTSISEYTAYKGRNIVFPAALIILGIIYAVMGIMYPTADGFSVIFIVTVALYILLGVMLYFRKPYLKIGRDSLITTKFNRDRLISSSQVKNIRLQKGYVVIEHSSKGGSWVFSRALNRYDTDAMSEHLRTFAAQHKISIQEKA